MQPKFRSKHQKLILQCYPAGRGTDKKPNPSELSYLLYYVSTRRSKLTKVGLFLERKAQSDVYRGRSGNVQVTLDITKALIERCPEDLNLFARNVVSILTSVVSSNDLSLSQHASPVFDTFCHFHDGALFRGDPLYVKDFQHLVSLYLAIARGADSGPNALQWKLVGIEAVKSIASSVALSTPAGKSQVEEIISLLLSCLSLDDDGACLLSLQSQITNAESRRDNPRASLQLTRRATINFTGEQLLLYTAMQALRHFFDTTSTDQLRNATNHTVKFILSTNAPPLWSTTLAEIVTTCAPVQTRFAVLTELVEQLVVLSPTETVKQLAVARLVSSLLSSSVNMIGLSVIDILRSLVHLQMQILKSVEPSALKTGNPSPFELILALKDCVAALASHNYYAAQISDMITEVLARCQYPGRLSAMTSGTGTPRLGSVSRSQDASDLSASEKPHSSGINSIFLINSLETISMIILISSGKVGGLEKSHLSIQSWDGTQHLLNHESLDVRVAYTNALTVFLKNCNSSTDTSMKTLTNFNVLEGPYGSLIIELYKLATQIPGESVNFLIVYHVIRAIIHSCDDNGVLRVCSLAFSLERESSAIFSGDNSKQYAFEQGIAFGSISQAIVYHVGRKFKSEQLTTAVVDEIKLRQHQNIWYTPIDVFTSHSLSNDLATAKTFNGSSLESGNVQNIHSIDKPQLFTILSQAVNEFQPSMDQISNTNLAVGVGYLGSRMPTLSKSDNPASDSYQIVNRARSLKQLNNKLQDMNGMNNSGYLPTNATINSVSKLNGQAVNGQDNYQNGKTEETGDNLHPHHSRPNRSNSLLDNRSIHTIADLRRDFSPRVKDLKKAASGFNVGMRPPSLSMSNRYATSLHSTQSSDFAGSAASFHYSHPNSPTNTQHNINPVEGHPTVNGNNNEKLDVMSFLGSLSSDISNDRGRLV